MRSLLIKLIFSLVPIIGSLLGFIWFDVFRIRRKVAIDNVALAFPELTKKECVKMARRSVYNMGKSFVEYFLFPLMRRSDFEKYVEIRGAELVDESLLQGKGAFFLTLHTGNGDLATAALSKSGMKVSLISKLFKAKWLNDIWFKLREKHGTEFILPRRSSFDILRAIKNGRLVVFVLDQFMGPPIGAKVKFFGKETGAAMGLAVMADRTQRPVIPIMTWRKPNGHHCIQLFDPVPWKSLDVGLSHDENIRAMTQVYTDKIEEMVRLCPEQWMWIHRRWKIYRVG